MSACLESEQNGSPDSQAVEADGKPTREGNKSRKIMEALRGLFAEPNSLPPVESGRTVADMPNKKIKPIDTEVLSAFSSPKKSLEDVHKRVTRSKSNLEVQPDRTPIAGILNWDRKNEKAYGLLTSLYDIVRDSEKKVGDPIADCLAVISRTNNGILALADGVGWGEKSRLAAWCAVYGCVTHLCEQLHYAQTTKDVFRILLDSFQKAHHYIVQEDATMSTLCACVVVELHERNKWGVCMVNVGDSLGFVYDKSFGVSEITIGSHPVHEHRDMRFAGGALGPVDGYNPDLTNLTLSYTVVNEHSIVFLSSDGISDNFDPQVGHFLIPISPKSNVNPKRRGSNYLESMSRLQHHEARKRSSSDVDKKDNIVSSDNFFKTSTELSPPNIVHVPQFTPEERHSGMLEKLREVIEEGDFEGMIACTARDVCARCVNFVCRNTEEKRQLYQMKGLNPDEMNKLTGEQRKAREKELKMEVEATKGKLDHASIVAFVVGHEEKKPFELFQNGRTLMYGDLPSANSPKKLSPSSSPLTPRLRITDTLVEEDYSSLLNEGVEMDVYSPGPNPETTNLAFCSIK